MSDEEKKHSAPKSRFGKKTAFGTKSLFDEPSTESPGSQESQKPPVSRKFRPSVESAGNQDSMSLEKQDLKPSGKQEPKPVGKQDSKSSGKQELKSDGKQDPKTFGQTGKSKISQESRKEEFSKRSQNRPSDASSPTSDTPPPNTANRPLSAENPSPTPETQPPDSANPPPSSDTPPFTSKNPSPTPETPPPDSANPQPTSETPSPTSGDQPVDPPKKRHRELKDEQGRNYLSPEAVNAWRISGAIGSLTYWIIPIIYGVVVVAGSNWPVWPMYLLGLFFLTLTILEGSIIPYIRWKRWRYQVDHNEIDLQRGLFVVTRTLIPIKRVQHVDTRQGPIYRQFGLASVTITTAGDVHEIPALSEPVADNLRNTISEYARVAREDL